MASDLTCFSGWKKVFTEPDGTETTCTHRQPTSMGPPGSEVSPSWTQTTIPCGQCMNPGASKPSSLSRASPIRHQFGLCPASLVNSAGWQESGFMLIDRHMPLLTRRKPSVILTFRGEQAADVVAALQKVDWWYDIKDTCFADRAVTAVQEALAAR